MRSSSDPLLPSYGTKEGALQLIRAGLKRGAYDSAASLALECETRDYLLGTSEKLLLSVGLQLVLDDEDAVARGKELWDEAVPRLVRKGQFTLIIEHAFYLIEADLAGRDEVSAYGHLELAHGMIVQSGYGSSDRLQYASYVDQYLRIFGDIDGSRRLRL
jgi:hypothetical protein